MLPAIARGGDADRREAGAQYVLYVQSVYAAFDRCNEQWSALEAFYAGARKGEKP